MITKRKSICSKSLTVWESILWMELFWRYVFEHCTGLDVHAEANVAIWWLV